MARGTFPGPHEGVLSVKTRAGSILAYFLFIRKTLLLMKELAD